MSVPRLRSFAPFSLTVQLSCLKFYPGCCDLPPRTWHAGQNDSTRLLPLMWRRNGSWNISPTGPGMRPSCTRRPQRRGSAQAPSTEPATVWACSASGVFGPWPDRCCEASPGRPSRIGEHRCNMSKRYVAFQSSFSREPGRRLARIASERRPVANTTAWAIQAVAKRIRKSPTTVKTSMPCDNRPMVPATIANQAKTRQAARSLARMASETRLTPKTTASAIQVAAEAKFGPGSVPIAPGRLNPHFPDELPRFGMQFAPHP